MEPVLLDGGLATELEARGHDLSDALWSARLLADDPEEIRAVHEAYVAAGSECVITASYQASFEGFAARGVDGAEMLARSVRLARESGARLVAASVGPYGAFLADGSEYTGEYGAMDEAALLDWHRPRHAALCGAAPDYLAFETIPSLAEARALARLPGFPAWFAFTCRDAAHLRDGTPIERAARAVCDLPHTVAVGVNCTAPESVDELLERLRGVTSRPLVAYPNSGEQWDPRRRRWHGSRADFATAATRWIALGARFVGGCCRTGPSDVARMARALGG